MASHLAAIALSTTSTSRRYHDGLPSRREMNSSTFMMTSFFFATPRGRDESA